MSKSLKVNAILGLIQKTCHIIFPLIIFPYLSRVLGPESYGKFSFSNSIISYFLLAAMLGVNTYAVREGARIRDDSSALNTFVSEVYSINFIAMIISFLIVIIISLFVPFFQQYKQILLVLSITIPFTCFGREWLNTIYEDYLYITVRYVCLQVISIVCIFIFVKTPADVFKYSVIYSSAIVAGYFMNIIYTQKYAKIKITFSINLKQHLIPILILFGGQLATTVYIHSDITMIGILRDNDSVGLYTVASKIYILVKTIINVLTTVMIPRIVYYLGKKNKEKYIEFTQTLFYYLIILVVPCVAGLYFEADNILHLIGGEKYLVCKNVLQILSFSLFFAVLSGYFCNGILIPNRKEKDYLVITIIAASMNVILNIIFIPLLGIKGAAVTTLIAEFLVFIIASYRVHFFANRKFDLKTISTVIIGTVLVSFICFFVNTLRINSIIQLIVSIFSSSLIYVLVFLIFHDKYVLSLLKKNEK